VSFGTYARRVRDRDLSYAMRYCALRCAVSRYCPIGFHATWSFLSTVGNLKRDEEALLRALDVLETSRRAWLAELDAFAARRRVEKQRHRRTPTAAEQRRLRGYRWPGPDGHAAVLHTVGPLWKKHLASLFPETPPGTEAEFASFDATIGSFVSAYLDFGGELGPEEQDLLLACLREQTPNLGYPTGFWMAFDYFRRLRKIADLILSDTQEGLRP
jgi:hypothetical protein